MVGSSWVRGFGSSWVRGVGSSRVRGFVGSWAKLVRFMLNNSA